MPDPAGPPGGPPPLRPFGLVLHHDGRWTHEGIPIQNDRLRSAFDRSVRYLPEEDKFVVQLGKFRGQIELEEAGFFVRSYDPALGEISLSDGSVESLATETLHVSPLGGALLCRVKREIHPPGLLARFRHAAQAELLNAVEDRGSGPRLRVAGVTRSLPPL